MPAPGGETLHLSRPRWGPLVSRLARCRGGPRSVVPVGCVEDGYLKRRHLRRDDEKRLHTTMVDAAEHVRPAPAVSREAAKYVRARYIARLPVTSSRPMTATYHRQVWNQRTRSSHCLRHFACHGTFAPPSQSTSVKSNPTGLLHSGHSGGGCDGAPGAALEPRESTERTRRMMRCGRRRSAGALVDTSESDVCVSWILLASRA